MESVDAGEGFLHVGVESAEPPGGCRRAGMATVGSDLAGCDEGDSDPESGKKARLAADR